MQTVKRPSILPHMGAGAENQRSAQAEVGEQQLPLLLEDGLPLCLLDPHRHIAQESPAFGHSPLRSPGGLRRVGGGRMHQLRRHAAPSRWSRSEDRKQPPEASTSAASRVSAASPFTPGECGPPWPAGAPPGPQTMDNILAPQSHEKRVDDIRRPSDCGTNPPRVPS
jgi:hypothetical protein